METKIKLPFNPELPSALSKERINEINDLCLKAQFNEDGYIADNEVNECSLIIETYGLKEVYEKIYDMGMGEGFYWHIDHAFELLLKGRPNATVEVFNTYRELTGIFRVLEKHQGFISAKLDEASTILADIEILDDEDIDRRKLLKVG